MLEIVEASVSRKGITDAGWATKRQLDTDAVAEMKVHAGTKKKVIPCLWWWWLTQQNPDPNDADNYRESFNAIINDVDGIAGWNFSGYYQEEYRRLDTYTGQGVPELWTEIGDLNDAANS